MSNKPMSENWVIVTGGSRGIGKSIVERLARKGYAVVFTYKSSERESVELERSLTAAGCRVDGRKCDGADPDSVMSLGLDLLNERGAPYAVVNNMGITQDANILSMLREQWDTVISTNLNSAFYFSQAFARSMSEAQGGSIIQISSVSGIKGNAGQTNYGATKAGLIGFTKSMAVELARFNVRANAVLPGFIQTEMVDEIPEGKKSQIVRQVPLRRLGRTEEVACCVEYLISPEASYITGQILVIDGGLTA